MTIRNRAAYRTRGHRRVTAKGIHANMPVKSVPSSARHYYRTAKVTRRRRTIADKRGQKPAAAQERILYRRPPRNRGERLRRRIEQRGFATRRGKDWDALTRNQKLRRVRFGSHAYCRNLRDVRDLATLNAQIAHDIELRAVQTWRLNRRQKRRLGRILGFDASDRLAASNKLVRIEAACRLARRMTHLFRRSNQYFYWVTLIHDGWHDSKNATLIDLEDIEARVGRVLQGLGVSWFGIVELDVFNNYYHPRGGERVTPHVHLLIWTDESMRAGELVAQMHTGQLKSELGAPVAVVERVRSKRRLSHLCYYMTKANHRLKSLGQVDARTGRRKTYPVEISVRPGQILRLAEILSYIDIGELMLAHGAGEQIKRRLLNSLSRSRALSHNPHNRAGDTAVMWQSMMPAWRRRNAHVRIARRD